MGHAVQLPDELYAEVAAYAQQQHETPDDVIVSWVAEAAQRVKTAPAANQQESSYDPAKDPLARFIGRFSSGASDLAKRHDDYLAEAYADDHE